MEDKRCFICKFTEEPKPGTSVANFYGKNNSAIPLHFCTSHSVEFFRMGQIKFFAQYSHLFKGYYGSEADEKLLRSLGLR